MDTKIKNRIISVSFTFILGAMMIINILSPDKEISYEERRKLSTFPKFKVEDILNGDYPLLNKTLSHSLSYLYLRLLVEKKLVSKFSINTKKYDNLGSIILKAYNGKDKRNIVKRVFLISKKTLLNEFNHFEGNMSIFQPAIDISDYTLQKEKVDIINFINNE